MSEIKKIAKPSYRPVLQPEDYYINEAGLMVFTESFHLKRGYCCKSGCKYCPYGETDRKNSLGTP